MSRKFLIVALALGSVPATAQTTDCSTLYGQTTCRTRPQSGVDWGLLFRPSQEAAQNQRLEQEARLLRQRAQLDAQQAAQSEDAANEVRVAAARRRAAGEMIAAGDCPGARAFALKAGDFALAEQVKAACQ